MGSPDAYEGSAPLSVIELAKAILRASENAP
jgi:hypothetical protein